MTRQAKSPFMEAMYDGMSALCEAGMVDKQTMRSFDALCLVPDVPEYSQEAIRNIRAKLNISQAVLATVMNASTVTVQKWESGSKRPNPMAMKLLNLLDRKGLAALL